MRAPCRIARELGWALPAIGLLLCSGRVAADAPTTPRAPKPRAAHAAEPDPGTPPGHGTITGVRHRAPTPAWVVPVAMGSAEATSGLAVLVVDGQHRLSREGVAVRYARGARRPVTVAGLRAAAEVRLQYAPSYQRYAWHMLRIHRGDQVIDALAAAEVTQGTMPDYDDVGGALEVTAYVRDVRVGDVVEYAYSVTGQQPALGDHYALGLDLGRTYPVGVLHERLVWPEELPLHVKTHGAEDPPRIETHDGYRSYTWLKPSPEPIEIEDGTPDWFDAMPWAQVSDFGSWADVVRWALPMYQETEPPGPELREVVERCAAEAGPAERLQCVVRFVQEDIRYVSFEYGRGSLEPRPPSLVLARRFGDCKDKALLMVTLLGALGITATPALVSSRDGSHVRRLHPSPYAFDHLVVRADLASGPVWIDTTATYQRGSPDRWTPPDYGAALPIAEGTKGLASIGLAAPSEPLMEVLERIRVADTDGPATLEVRTRYRGEAAQDMRMRLATQPREELQSAYREFYAERWNRTEVAAPLEISDDEQRDVIEVREHYAVGELWDHGAELTAWAIDAGLTRLDDDEKRSMPLELEHPRYVRQVIVVDLPTAFDIRDEDERIDGTYFEASHSTRYDATTDQLRLVYEYRSREDHLPPRAQEAYRKDVEKLDDFLGYELVEGKERPPSGWGLAFPLVFVLGVLGYVARQTLPQWWRARRRRRRFEKAGEADVGETPARPIEVDSTARIPQAMGRLLCKCGGWPPRVNSMPTPVRYMGETLLCQKARCPACEETMSRYFRVTAEPPASDATTPSVT